MNINLCMVIWPSGIRLPSATIIAKLKDATMTKRICSIPNCGNKNLARGYCNKHYQRFLSYGDPLFIKIAERGNPLKFLKSNIGTEKHDCIDWPYGLNGQGYGAVVFNKNRMSASRAMCIMAHGEPHKDRFEAAHSCGNRICVNPNHLRWASAYENSMDRVQHGTANRGERHGRAKLIEKDVLEIRQSELSQYKLAEIYGVDQGTISHIKSRKSWSWLEPSETLKINGKLKVS